MTTGPWWRAGLVAGVLAVVAGCGGAPAPGEAVPGLRSQLSRVDSALVDRQYGAARTALNALVRETVDAREAGRITADQADQILAAAARLAADLPAGAGPTPTPAAPATRGPTATPAPTSAPAPPSTPPGSGREEGADKGKKDDKKDEEKKGKDDGGGDGGDGGGDGGGNGPDDGHGN
jgi:hypothetical protein